MLGLQIVSEVGLGLSVSIILPRLRPTCCCNPNPIIVMVLLHVILFPYRYIFICILSHLGIPFASRTRGTLALDWPTYLDSFADFGVFSVSLLSDHIICTGMSLG